MNSVPSDEQPPASDRPSASEMLRQTFALHQDELLGMLYFLSAGLEQAREAMQETFEKCWRHRHSAVEKVDLKAWIFRLAVNVARDLRHGAKHRLQPLDLSQAAELTDSMSPPRDPVARSRLIRFRRAISQLRSQEREIFFLRQNGALSYEEIARSLSLPVAMVKSRMRLTLGILREAAESGEL
jgi:RNA polymerase sigma-70 factor (ECF subfamily)